MHMRTWPGTQSDTELQSVWPIPHAPSLQTRSSHNPRSAPQHTPPHNNFKPATPGQISPCNCQKVPEGGAADAEP